MRATSPDSAFEFRILERDGKIIAQVYSNIRHSFDITGKADNTPNWTFTSVEEAKGWAQQHLINVLKVPGELKWS